MRRITLTGTFAVVSLTTMVLLAVVVTWLVATSLQRQAQRDGEQLAENYVAQGVQSKIDAQSVQFWKDPTSVPVPVVDSLDTIVRANSVQVLTSLSLYTPDGDPLWTSTGRPDEAPPLDTARAADAATVSGRRRKWSTPRPGVHSR